MPVFHFYAPNLLLVVLLSFLVGLDGGLRNTIQITLSTLCNATATLLLVLLQDADLLQSLEDLAVYAAGGIDMVRWARTTVAGRAVNLAQAADTDCLAEVDVAGNGCGAGVEPVDGLGWELLRWAGLDGINPT